MIPVAAGAAITVFEASHPAVSVNLRPAHASECAGDRGPDPGALCYEGIGVRLAMLREVEDIVLNFTASIKVAFGDNQFVSEGGAFRNDLPSWCDDAAAADQIAIFLASGFRNANHPCAVLICAGLHGQVIVKVLKPIVLGRARVVHGRVVAEHDQLDPLQSKNPKRFGPASVIANAHSDFATECIECIKTHITHFEIPFLQVLKWKIGFILGMSG